MPPIAAAAVPVAKSSLTRTVADRQVQVRVHVDAAGHEEPAPAVDDRLARPRAIEIGTDLGDPSVGADPQVGAPLPVDVEHGPAGQRASPSVAITPVHRMLH